METYDPNNCPNSCAGRMCSIFMRSVAYEGDAILSEPEPSAPQPSEPSTLHPGPCLGFRV